jgi:hypothetical protein
MKLTAQELEFLAAWAREEWEPACYGLPAHRLQLGHGVSGASLALLIKAWATTERKKDQDILQILATTEPVWPWAKKEAFQDRMAEANRQRTQPGIPAA